MGAERMKVAMMIRSLRERTHEMENWHELEADVPIVVREALDVISTYVDKHTKPEMHERSAAEQIEPQARSNEEFFSQMVHRVGDWADDKRSIGEIYDESPLSVERKGDVIELLESTGGPADGYKVTFDPESGIVEKVRYWFQPWFDGAEIELREGEYPHTWAYVAHFASMLSDD